MTMNQEGDITIEKQLMEESMTNEVSEGGKGCCMCSWFQFNGNTTAKGFCLHGVGRGAVVMSNIFISSAFIYLASEAAGCVDAEGVVAESCDAKAYGMDPTALIANIVVASGLLSAFFMPFAGAMVDYTSHRRLVGVLSAISIILIQAVQIGTTSATWFPMAILQGVAGFLYQVQVLAVFAYLPEIGRAVGHVAMTHFQSTFTFAQFASQVTFLVIVIAVATTLKLDDVNTAQLGQGIDVVYSSLFFILGWRLLPKMPAAHVLPEGKKSLFLQSFVQVWHTIKNINSNYKRSLRWFYLAIVFAQAATNAFTTLAVVFLGDKLKMSATEIGIFFAITLLGSLPGSKIGAIITSNTSPRLSWRLCMLSLGVIASIGALTLTNGVNQYLVYAWGFIVGTMLGWYYPVEGVHLSMLLPVGQEAELTGFYVYCTQILGWLPPLIFSALVENGIDQKFGLLAVVAFYVPAILCVSLMAPWKESILECHPGMSEKETDVEKIVIREMTASSVVDISTEETNIHEC